MKKLLILLAAFFPVLVLAYNSPPVASGTTTLNRWVIYPGEEALTLTGAASFDGDGWVDAYEWIVKLGPNTISSSGTRTVATYAITLPALSNPATDQNVYTCSLRVRDNKGSWSSWKLYTLFHRHSVSIYYLTDHIGNVRATVDHKGNLVGYDDYDPFGNALPGRSTNIGDPKDIYKFTGVERDSEIGLDAFGSRMYDPEIGRFLGVDRFAHKYPYINPYQYGLNNPIRNIDVNGDSIFVMINPKAVSRAGHMGALIQNSDGKWALWSKNGTQQNSGYSGEQDGKKGDDVGNKAFDSPQAFLGSERNKKEGYTEGFVIPTTPEQDASAEIEFKKQTDAPYHLLDSSCSTAVENAVQAAGAPNGRSKVGTFDNAAKVYDMFVNAIPKVSFTNMKTANEEIKK